MEKPSLWWNYMSGAARYLQDTVAATSNYRVIVLEEPPYKEDFFHLLKERLLQCDSSLQIGQIRADEWAQDMDVGEALMNDYAHQVEYHPMDGTRSEYIAKNDLLSGRVLMVREMNCRTKWIDFAIEYAKFSSQRNGLLVLTYSVTSPLPTARKGMKLLQWSDYVAHYDMQLFASYCIAERPGLTVGLRNYITQIASRMAGTDPELCSKLTVEGVVNNAFELLRELASDYETARDLVDNPEKVSSIIWEAQIHVVFPIIEEMRRYFIKRYSDELQGELPQRDNFEKLLELPQDMELRHMWYYYFKTNGFHNSNDERSFRLLYEARNQLAHLDLLNSKMIVDILSLQYD
ncbi:MULTISPECIES: hypothetical protein [Brevibacillus]|uniref:hypothetical protein n=1 Tax=Brevibacillus TaxID=55080 RepID=UPI001F6096EE|nr:MULTISPECIES: hypothetical protein [Brevibacillus]MDH6348959.1 hypothetical protein [Brevibacillus sp. 1238]MDR5000978.1 hypothetical protein [Brevibacillus parabrevis]